jgi:conjugal transfer pilin signal peptidase TrbI
MNDMAFRRNSTILLILALVFVISLQLISQRYGFYVVREDHMCLPYKYLYVKKGIIPEHYGELISFKSSGIQNFADGITFTKIITGLPGDRIRREIFSEEERQKNTFHFEKKGEPVTLRLQGRIHLHRKGERDPVTYDVIETDSLGRSLPMVEEMVIPEGRYFVTGTEDRTFDSRYWGLIHEEQVIGQAFPLPLQQKKI